MRFDERRVMTLGGFNGAVAQQQAHRADVGPGFEQAAGEGVAEPVRMGVDACDFAQAGDYAAELVNAGIKGAAGPEKWLLRLWQRGKRLSDAWMKENADWDARLLGNGDGEVVPAHAGSTERGGVTDAQAGVEQEQHESAGANPAEVDEGWVIAREPVARLEQRIHLGARERQRRGAGVLRHPQTECRVPGGPAAIGGELEELPDDLQLPPAGGGGNLAAGAVARERVQGDVGYGLRPVRFPQVAQRVRVLPHRRGRKPTGRAIRKESLCRRAHGHLGRQAGIDLAALQQGNAGYGAVPGTGFEGAAVSTPAQLSVAPDGAGTPLPANAFIAVRAGFEVASIGFEHDGKNITRGTRFGTRLRKDG